MANKNQKITSKPPVSKGEFSFCLTADEILSIVSILGFSQEIFEKMAQNSAIEGDTGAHDSFMLRSQVSYALYEKFRDIASMGEPVSREIH